MIPRTERIKKTKQLIKKIRAEQRLKRTKKGTTIVGTSLLLGTATLPNLMIGSVSASMVAGNQSTSSSMNNSSGSQTISSSAVEQSQEQVVEVPKQVATSSSQSTASAPSQSSSSKPISQPTQNQSARKPTVNTSASSATHTVPISSEKATAFIDSIKEEAQTLASDNDLYASVMIAQAALESGFGTSGVSSAPNYNLFGVKGSYGEESVNMTTREDDGSGHLYQINATFRRYPSYKEALEDYIQVIKTTNLGNGAYYKGAWKSQTTSYKDATAYLQGRYATSTQYSASLNQLIEAYHLTDYDDAPVAVQEQYTVQAGDSLWKIAMEHNTTVEALKAANGLNSDLILVGQQLNL